MDIVVGEIHRQDVAGLTIPDAIYLTFGDVHSQDATGLAISYAIYLTFPEVLPL
jgi:hypothetical protein